MRIFSGIQPTGAKHFGNYSRRLPPVRGDAGAAATAFFCVVDLHSITVDYDPADLRERTLDLAALLFATGLDPERSTVFAQSHVTAHAEAAWLLVVGDELRPARPDDAVQGEGRAAGVRLRRPLHLPGADGRRHPALPDRPRPDRRRPAPAPRARARRRRAVQHALRRDVHGAGGRLPGGRRADHGPAGADEEDVDDRRHAAGDAAAARPARRDPQEGARGGHRLRRARCAAATTSRA